ncbi:MAG: TonB-dependent receptor [Gammaproteobacteria bacterium]
MSLPSAPSLPARPQVRTLAVALAAASALFATHPPHAADEPQAANAAVPGDDKEVVTLSDLTITARNREEIAQEVPIPVSVIGNKTLERDNVATIEEVVRKAPGLGATTPNARRTGISLRGIGKASGNDSMEAAVGLIVDGVVLSHVGMSYQDFTDLDRVEVLRGPQGTLLGKNTTVGAINYVTRQPRFTPEAQANVSFGQRNARLFNGSVSNAIVDDLLAYRVSFFTDKQDGDLLNIGSEGGRWHERNRSGGRVQFLLTPTPNFSARLNIDTAETNERSNTKPVMLDPANFDDAAHTPRVKTVAGNIAAQNRGTNTLTSLFQRPYFKGYQPIIGSWTTLDLNQAQPLQTRNRGAAAELNWDVAGVTLTSITAYRDLRFDAKNDNEQTRFSVTRGGTLVQAKQASQELRIASSPSKQFDYQAGLFYMKNSADSYSRNLYGEDAGAFYAKNGDYALLSASGAGTALLRGALANAYTADLTTPETKSAAVFGQVNWHFNEKATLTVGLRETHEKKTATDTKWANQFDGSPLTDLTALGTSLGFAANSQEIKSAQAVRTAAIGSNFFPTSQGDPINHSALSWLVSPSYKLDETTMLYASAAAGEKSGSVQFKSNGSPNTVLPEKSLDFELGFKTLLLNKTLMLNVNAYNTRVRDYQQNTSVYDDIVTRQMNDGTLYYASRLGNIPSLRARGVEFDSAWQVNRALSVNLGGSYNDAKYTDWKTATCPVELNVAANSIVCDNTGRQVIAAPKVTATFGVDYQAPLVAGYNSHVWIVNSYRSKHNLTDTLSRYGEQKAYSLTDIGIGLIGKGGKFELDLVVKNAFDTKYTTSITQYSATNGVAYDGIGPRRWVGLTLHAKL